MMFRSVLFATMVVALPATAAPEFGPVRKLLTEAVEEGQVAGGSVLVLQKGEVVFEEGFGFADLKTKKPFAVDTPVVVASISKPLLGTAAFHLAERKVVNLSSPITEYLPEFNEAKLESGAKLERPPTMIELFSHTAGTRHDEASGGRLWFASWTKELSLEDVVERVAAEYPFEAHPGTRFAYSGVGTDIAARVLEVATGQSRNELFVAEVAKPLGMKNTYYRDTESLKKLEPMPTRYFISKEGDLKVSRYRDAPLPAHYNSSGGNIISTAPDLGRWLLMICDGGKHGGEAFLAPETVTKMLSRTSRGNFACGGLAIRKRDDAGKALVVGHTGSSGTNCWIDIEKDVVGIMLTQTKGKDIGPFRRALEKLVGECVAAAGEPE